MIKKTMYLVAAFILMASCGEKQPSYQLTGHIEGLEKGEKVYLYSNKERADVDSVVNDEGGFLFTGTVSSPELYYVIIRREGQNTIYKSFWLENNSISVNGDVNDFQNARVEGSEVQFQQEQFNDQIKPLADALNVLYEQYNPNDAVQAQIISDKIDSVMALEDKEKAKFIKLNPDYFYSAFLAKRVVRNLSPEEGKEVYESLSEANKETKYGLATKEFLELNKNLAIGDEAVELSLPDMEGNVITLSSLKGKYVLIDFWASWCGPCRRESPYLTKAYEMFNDKGFEIYSVSIDDNKDKWKKAVAEDNMTWPTVLADGAFDSKSAMQYGVKYIPFNYLIDPDGKIIEMHLRGEALVEKLEELL